MSNCKALSKEEAEAIWAACEASKQLRAASMPTVEVAVSVMFDAWQRLNELGWREAMYCPKDGSTFEVIEAGSTGIHRCHYHGEWPNGWWISELGDLWPSHPILWRPIPSETVDFRNREPPHCPTCSCGMPHPPQCESPK